MTKTEAKKIRAYLREENKKWPDALTPVEPAQWPRCDDTTRFAVYRSKSFLAQCFDEGCGIVRISVIRTMVRECGGWEDHITWDELQSLKAQCGYAERAAVEVYPADEHIVNVANLRHLWVLPAPLPFMWTKDNR